MKLTIQEKPIDISKILAKMDSDYLKNPIKDFDEPVRFKGPRGKEYASFRDVRRAELAEISFIERDELGLRRERHLTPEEIEDMLDQELGQYKES